MGLGDRVHVFSYPSIGGDALTYTPGVVSGFLRMASFVLSAPSEDYCADACDEAAIPGDEVGPVQPVLDDIDLRRLS